MPKTITLESRYTNSGFDIQLKDYNNNHLFDGPDEALACQRQSAGASENCLPWNEEVHGNEFFGTYRHYLKLKDLSGLQINNVAQLIGSLFASRSTENLYRKEYKSEVDPFDPAMVLNLAQQADQNVSNVFVSTKHWNEYAEFKMKLACGDVLTTLLRHIETGDSNEEREHLYNLYLSLGGDPHRHLPETKTAQKTQQLATQPDPTQTKPDSDESYSSLLSPFGVTAGLLLGTVIAPVYAIKNDPEIKKPFTAIKLLVATPFGSLFGAGVGSGAAIDLGPQKKSTEKN